MIIMLMAWVSNNEYTYVAILLQLYGTDLTQNAPTDIFDEF